MRREGCYPYAPTRRAFVCPAGLAECAEPNQGGALCRRKGVSRTVFPTPSPSTPHHHRRTRQACGVGALFAAKGGRKSSIGADEDMLAFVGEMLSAGSANVRAQNIQETLAARFPERTQPGIASVRRFVRRWRRERDESGDRMQRDKRTGLMGWKARLIRNQKVSSSESWKTKRLRIYQMTSSGTCLLPSGQCWKRSKPMSRFARARLATVGSIPARCEMTL